MNKPIPVTNITIKLPENLSEEEKQKISMQMIQDIMNKSAQEQRDYEIYKKGFNDGRSILSLFGL